MNNWQEGVYELHKKLLPIVQEVRARFPGIQINFDGGYSLVNLHSHNEELIQRIEGMMPDEMEDGPLYDLGLNDGRMQAYKLIINLIKNDRE